MIGKPFSHFLQYFERPVVIFTGMIAISIAAVVAAIASELFLGLEPCQLCIYQRWVFVATTLIGIFGLIGSSERRASIAFTLAGGFVFLLNSAVAFYHTGVEQKWWVSALEGCGVPEGFLENSTDNQTWLENIMAAPSAPCSMIPWQDPVLGLSMANYNMIMCFGLFIACMIAAMRLKKSDINIKV